MIGVGGTDDGILLAGVNVAGGITNSSAISVSGGAVNVGIAVASSAAAAANSSIGGSISNLGSITAGTGILVSGGSTVAAGIGNSGNIDGSRAAIDLTGEGSATTITQSAGTVTGSILPSSFADTLDVIGGTIDGDITGLGSSETVGARAGLRQYIYLRQYDQRREQRRSRERRACAWQWRTDHRQFDLEWHTRDPRTRHRIGPDQRRHRGCHDRRPYRPWVPEFSPPATKQSGNKPAPPARSVWRPGAVRHLPCWPWPARMRREISPSSATI